MNYERIAVIGDSILWGQGLREASKIATRVREQLAATQAAAPAIVSFAHSGADVWDDGETDVHQLDPLPSPLAPLGEIPTEVERNSRLASPEPARRQEIGEIPREEPYSLREIDAARDELAGQRVDLVLLDAGINDVNVAHIVLPFVSRQNLALRTQSVRDRLRILVRHAHDSFPDARIVVTGYYRIVSEFSRVDRLLRYAAQYVERAPLARRRLAKVSAFEGPLQSVEAMLERRHELEAFAAGRSILSLTIEPWRLRMVELSAIFADLINQTIRDVVAEINDACGDVARAAIPIIPGANAIMTDDPWIWGLDPDLAPEDEVVEGRRALVARETASSFEQFVWNRASVGHPNVRGAQAYADAIIASLP